MCLRMSEKKRSLPGHKIYTNQGEGSQVDKTVPEPASRVWLARDDISEWKQWVLLRLAPYHWQRAGGSRLCKPKSLLLLECSALGASSRTVGPRATQLRGVWCTRLCGRRGTYNCQPKTEQQATEMIRAPSSFPPWPRAPRRSPLLDSIRQIQLANPPIPDLPLLLAQ